MNNFNTYEKFNFSSKEEMLKATATDVKLMSIIAIENIFIDRTNISFPIMFLSSKTSGNDNMNIPNILEYLYKNIKEEDLLELTKELILINKIFKDKEDLINDDIYKILDFQTKEKMDKYLDDTSLELAKTLLKFPEISLSLKIFSEITTKIDFYKIIDYIDYINKVMTDEERYIFLKILKIKD